MGRPAILLFLGATALAVVLASVGDAWAQSSSSGRRSMGNLDPNPPRRSMGNLSPNPPRRSMGNLQPSQPDYSSQQSNRSSRSSGQVSRGVTVVVPNPYYRGYYYPAAPAYPVPVYTPYGVGSVYVPAPGYYYPYYCRPGYYVVPPNLRGF